MSRSHRTTRSIRIAAAFVVATLGLASLLGCSSDKVTNPPPGGAGSTTYTGTVSGTGVDGKLTITIATSSPAPQNAGYRAVALITATGTYTPTGGAAIGLTGNYEDGPKHVTLSGGDWAFEGDLTGTRIDGDCAHTTGTEVGVFTIIKGGSEVTTIIGTYTSTTVPPADNGHFNLSISGTEVHGTAVSDDGGTVIPLDGTYNASTGAISIVNPANPTGPPAATGNYNSTTGHASGTYTDGMGTVIGTWEGDKE